MRRWQKALAASSVALAVLVPSGVALAATSNGPAGSGTCTGDQQMLHLRDGTGWRHTTADGTTVQMVPGSGHHHMSGPRDGSGPQADRALDGTGWQWRSSS